MSLLKPASLTPRYAYDRTRQLLYARRNPDHPWLTPAAIQLLTTLLRPGDRGIEFGSGRSTLWLAARTAHLISVEEDERWYDSVRERLTGAGVTNVDQVLAPYEQPEHLGEQTEYVRTLARLPAASLDYALIDGAYRAHTARAAMTRLRPGGLMIIDNVNWYLPSPSRAPASRPLAAGPDERWTEVARELEQWRSIWTGSGVWDTAIFVRPA